MPCARWLPFFSRLFRRGSIRLQERGGNRLRTAQPGKALRLLIHIVLVDILLHRAEKRLRNGERRTVKHGKVHRHLMFLQKRRDSGGRNTECFRFWIAIAPA